MKRLCAFCGTKHKNVHELTCCDSTICRKCYAKYLNSKQLCPICKGIFSQSHIKHDSICSVHDKPYEYFCVTCGSYLCSDCLLEELNNDKKHEGHSLTKLPDNSVTKKLDKIESGLEQQMEMIETLKDEASIEIYNTFNLIKEHLKEHVKSKEEKLNGDAKRVLDAMKDTLELTNRMEHYLVDDDPSGVIGIEELIEKIKEMKKRAADIVVSTQTIEWVNEVIPEPQTVHLTLPGVWQFLDSSEGESRMRSDSFKCLDSMWNITINHSRKTESSEFTVGVFLRQSPISDVSFTFTIEIVPFNEYEDTIVKKSSAKLTPEEDIGWNYVAKVRDLTDRGFFNPDGSMNVIVTIGYASYCEESKALDQMLSNK